MRINRRRRTGFTLPEVLVTVSIIAILSAVVVPSVVRQVDKGDTGRLSADISSDRTAVEQFVSDVRKYPRNVGQLVHAIAATDSDLVNSAVYTTNQTNRWKGPYVSKDSTGMLRTAYNWQFNPQFVIDTFAATPFTKALALRTDSTLDKAQVLALDTLLDDGNGSTGTIRFSGATVGRLKVILIPIQ